MFKKEKYDKNKIKNLKNNMNSNYNSAKLLYNNKMYNECIFLCQNSAECGIKAYLGKLNKELPKSHNIPLLLKVNYDKIWDVNKPLILELIKCSDVLYEIGTDAKYNEKQFSKNEAKFILENCLNIIKIINKLVR